MNTRPEVQKEDEIIDIFDENEQKIGTEKWLVVHAKGLLHQVAGVFVFKDASEKELLIAQRGATLQSPNLWSHSAGGHIIAGESPAMGARNELQEELFSGNEVPPLKLHYFAHYREYEENDTRKDNEIVHLYKTYYAGPFYPDPVEVQAIEWVTIDTLLQDKANNPAKYTHFINKALDQYLDHAGTTRS